MRIEAGKYYKTRDGRKLGPAKSEGRKHLGQDAFEFPGSHVSIHLADGTYAGVSDRDLDLIAEWTDGPAVTETVTKTRIVPGVYGRIEVDSTHGEYVNIRFITEHGKSSGIWSFREDELDAAAAVLSALAKGLRDA